MIIGISQCLKDLQGWKVMKPDVYNDEPKMLEKMNLVRKTVKERCTGTYFHLIICRHYIIEQLEIIHRARVHVRIEHKKIHCEDSTVRFNKQNHEQIFIIRTNCKCWWLSGTGHHLQYINNENIRFH